MTIESTDRKVADSNDTPNDRHAHHLFSLYTTAALASKAQGHADLYQKYLSLSIDELPNVMEEESPFALLLAIPDVSALLSVPRFQHELNRSLLRYQAVWNTSGEFESLESHGLSPSEHLAKCQAMQAEGYRPASISAASTDSDPITASVWHRPEIPDDEKETLARRQANAAIAALRMGEMDVVWPLLRHSDDPRLRTWIIHRLSPMGASPDTIVTRLDNELDVSVRRALILILGEYAETAPIDRSTLSTELLGLYRDDPDPGIHGAAEWTLRRWGKATELAEIDTELSTGKTEGDRNWYSTKQGHTMVVIPGPVEFLMGSPYTDVDRQLYEELHRQRIGRNFAIASKEVTVRQYQEFKRQSSVRHAYMQTTAPEENCPQISVLWYNAAVYCRWLSEQEGVAEDQMCYPSIAEIKEGMKLPSDYLSRTGYRLPSEAEWEFACRSGAVTSRYYGQTDELLGQYAWLLETSNGRTWPVGSLKPNETGLFDMYGNVPEWCQERFLTYGSVLGSLSEGREDVATLVNSNLRVLRGGSFDSRSKYARSAARGLQGPKVKDVYRGFRVARTYYLSP